MAKLREFIGEIKEGESYDITLKGVNNLEILSEEIKSVLRKDKNLKVEIKHPNGSNITIASNDNSEKPFIIKDELGLTFMQNDFE